MNLSAAEIAEYREHFISYEGNVPHFYLDNDELPNVTIGIGFLVTDPTTYPLLRKSDNQPASRAEVFTDFNQVKAQPAGHAAEFYGVSCSCYLSSADTNRIFADRLVAIVADLERILPLDPLPKPAQKVSIDMVYNMGAPRLKAKFPRWLEHMRQGDYVAAAGECHRLKIQESRNVWAMDTLLSIGGRIE